MIVQPRPGEIQKKLPGHQPGMTITGGIITEMISLIITPGTGGTTMEMTNLIIIHGTGETSHPEIQWSVEIAGIAMRKLRRMRTGVSREM